MPEGLGNISIHKTYAGVSREALVERVYCRHFERLFTYAQVICNSREMAQDIVSDVFFKLWSSDADISKIEDIEAYLMVCVKNQAILQLTRSSKEKSRRKSVSLTDTIDWVDPSAVLLAKEFRRYLDGVVRSLPERCQLIFRLAREEGMKQKEIALELGVSTETVKTQLSRAQARLRSAIADYYVESGDRKTVDVRLIGEVILAIGISSWQIFSI